MTSMAAIDAHRLWAPTYDQIPNPLLALETRVVQPLLPPLEGALVLDVAGGTGRWSRYASSRGARAVTLDACEDMLRRAPLPRVLADARRLPLADAMANLTICAFAFSYTGDCLSELARVTRPGGMVIVSDMHPVASERGWSRSFRHGGSTISIAAERIALDKLAEPRLQRVDVVEAALGEPERVLFEQAGRPDLFDAAAGVPAVMAIQWVRV